jgi:hypothetical protein
MAWRWKAFRPQTWRALALANKHVTNAGWPSFVNYSLFAGTYSEIEALSKPVVR